MDILALLVVFIGFIILKFMVKQNISFSLRVIAATIIGIIIGFIFKGHTDYAGMIGSIFAGLLSAMVVPLLFFSIISTITSLNSVGRLRTIGAKTIGILSLQNVLGSLIAIILAIIFNLGKGSKLAPPADAGVHEVPTIIDTIKGFFPTNIVSNAAENQVIPVIIFSLFIAIGVLTYKKDKEKIKPFVDFIHSANEVIFRVISIITDFTPYAVLALMANAISRIDIENMAPILVVLLCVYIAGLFHILVSTSLLISIIAKLSPIKFLKKFFPAQSVAFTTQSSVGTIPVNEECLKIWAFQII
ncbi:MAG: cation:dicarboxylase symporter family transporter [Tissierellia bacterium]|nr:cation:dicarboxylase symporter family transporter [Tissierellia bacterium]